MIKKCRYCQSKVIYTKNNYGWIYKCTKCNAYVGCHKNTQVPFGTLANKELRTYRTYAHKYFDILWRYKKKRCNDNYARHKAYAWLAKEMKINKNDCHIGYFDIDQCKQVIDICKPYVEKILKNEKEN